MTRAEHLEWCKQRAREYLNRGEVADAVASMMSDMQKHPETAFDFGGVLGQLGLRAAQLGDLAEARRYVEGFN